MTAAKKRRAMKTIPAALEFTNYGDDGVWFIDLVTGSGKSRASLRVKNAKELRSALRLLKQKPITVRYRR